MRPRSLRVAEDIPSKLEVNEAIDLSLGHLFHVRITLELAVVAHFGFILFYFFWVLERSIMAKTSKVISGWFGTCLTFFQVIENVCDKSAVGGVGQVCLGVTYGSG